jgi:hypothetical protein
MERRCFYCGALIPQERLEVLPDAISCTACAAQSPPPLYRADDSWFGKRPVEANRWRYGQKRDAWGG